MSILIKGMEMPKNCGRCFLRVGQCSKRIYMESRPLDCPLIELPPHGRLIDADALIAAGWQLSRDNVFTGKFEAALLSSVPTIIEAEEGE